MAIQNILPDPNNYLNYAGGNQNSGYGPTTGPGYSAVKLTSNQPYLSDFTQSGRLIARIGSAHNWAIDIAYNPMTREEFEPVYTFLLSRQGPLKPFYAQLPQYSAPKNSDFSTFYSSNTLQVSGNFSSGEDSITLTDAGYDPDGADGYPSPGDIFTFTSTNSRHEKTYMVTAVHTPTNNEISPNPSANTIQIDITPPLQKDIFSADVVNFKDVKFKVIVEGPIQEYSLNTNNLYNFSLKLREVQ